VIDLTVHDDDDDADDTGVTEWMSGLAYKRDRQGNNILKPTLANIITILANDPSWRDVIAYDELGERVCTRRDPPWFSDDCPSNAVPGPWTDSDTTRITCWLARRWPIDVSSTMVGEAITVVAERNTFNELTEWLDSLRWDGVERLDTWLPIYAGTTDSAYARAIGRCWMIAAVGRAFTPGCKADHVIVLEGNQGTGKSTFVRTLAGRAEWFFDDDLEVGDKDAAQSLKGKWVVEFGEMHAMSKAEVTAVKAFVSRQADTYRASYGRHARTYPRRWVAIGTTNAEQYLSDATGNRRWWPIKTGTLRIPELREVVAQLWAEAVVRYRKGEHWHLEDPAIIAAATEEQAARLQIDPWTDIIADWLAKPEPRVLVSQMGYVTTRRVLEACLGMDADRIEKKHEMRVGDSLRVLGWQRWKFRNGARFEWGFRPVPSVSTSEQEGT